MSTASANQSDRDTEALVAAALRESETPFHDLNQQLTAAEKRDVCKPKDDELDETRFWLFCNLVSLNYLDVRATEWEVVPEHAMHWHRQIHTSPLNEILAGRKHTKTTWVLSEIMYACQYQQGYGCLYWANTQDQVRERMQELEEMVESNLWLDQLHDGGDCCGGREHKVFHNKSNVHTTWVTGAAEGAHVNMSVGDDPLKEIGGIPDVEIEAWYSKVIEPMLNRDGVHVIVGTRKRPNDLYEILRTKNKEEDWDLPSYDLVEYPAIREVWDRKYGDDRPGDLAPKELYTEVTHPTLANALDVPGDAIHILWPEGRPENWLARKLGAMGGPYFAREFCMVFEQVRDAIIERALIDERCSVHERPPDLIDVANSPYERTVVGVDPASTGGTDKSSFVVVGVRPAGVRDILHVYNAQSIAPSRFKSKLQELDLLYAPSDIVIEGNGMQQYIIDDAVEFDRDLPIRKEHTSVKKHSWETGIPRIAHRVTQGAYNFYRSGHDHTEQLINALTTLTMEEGELVGHTPDPVSALYQAEKAIDKAAPVGTIEVDDVGDEMSDEFRDSEIGQAVEEFRDKFRMQGL
ncbi:hypothetical protein ACFFQF_00870 [Haladaptatus pallidirubidus]|uniref:Terminase large subunit n=1 Tax=Haladaptatus pallidirubidus TaxID=1008152 RepID=A0AAV3UBK4_9EURY|nr:hypothetical protein [Haladaptatus pallidirubidus]